jgi:hypothetical protein
MRRLPKRKWARWVLALGLTATGTAMAQSGPTKGQNAFGDWRADGALLVSEDGNGTVWRIGH